MELFTVMCHVYKCKVPAKSDFSHIKIYTKYKKMKVTTAYFQM